MTEEEAPAATQLGLSGGGGGVARGWECLWGRYRHNVRPGLSVPGFGNAGSGLVWCWSMPVHSVMAMPPCLGLPVATWR